MTRIDWPGLMRVGIGQLGLAPEVFWRLTPAELHMLTGPDQPVPVPFSRARLDALVQGIADPAHRRACGAGLKTTPDPAASAASTPPAGIARGKFHGGATTVTRDGSNRAPGTASSSDAFAA
jgi:uncharacterized phage protein (TIGR02216 family)